IVNNLYHRVRNIMLDRKYQLVKKYSQTGKLLDYGAGTGYFPGYVKSKGHHVKAIEIDPDARLYAKSKFDLDVLPPESLVDGQLTDGEFDVVSLWHVMEHLYDPKSYVNSFKKLLMTNGHLIIAVPNYTASDAQFYSDKWAAYDVPRHLWHFNPVAMEKMVGDEGFVLVEKKTMPFDSFYVSLLSEKYKNGSTSLVGGFRRGFASFWKSQKNADKCSSVIYVFRKA
ncbi:class I SAM-dependent methyltransferase, partial [Saprospiraceae bacterium]|nr:class I SAM-dependent methyltransferase [Saprospiraceae bacterium]